MGQQLVPCTGVHPPVTVPHQLRFLVPLTVLMLPHTLYFFLITTGHFHTFTTNWAHTHIPAPLFLVLKRFPQRKTALRQMYHKSESFQSICHSYQKCSEAISYWSESRLNEALNRKREYEALLYELERNITQSLDEWN